ncbi:nuclear transport factor 2 family protein [Mycobacteroides abscessus]|uniref:nuclear transport factor 2 family protein n=1 Tax=Mycobacteroides abscessus TaxID=36809 RepID=UPI003AF8483C
MTRSNLTDPSPDHAKYEPLLREFLARVDQQEADSIARGLPAEGMARFVRNWFDAWRTQDVDKIRACITEDCTYTDSSTFQVRLGGRGLTADHCRVCFDAVPDIAFYPQDGTLRSLPYIDYFAGQWRMTIPWRGIGRHSGSASLLHRPDVVIPPSGRCINFIGIDRYVLTNDFKISHIDTDWDILYTAVQFAPFGVPVMNTALRLAARPSIFRAIGVAARLAMPLVRLLSKISPGPALVAEEAVANLYNGELPQYPVIVEQPPVIEDATAPVAAKPRRRSAI